MDPPSCLVSPHIPIHGLGEPQREYESVDEDGEVCGECAPEFDNGEEVTDHKHVHTPMCMPGPKVPSAAEKALHDLTHMPYRSWCYWCVAGRRNSSHRRPQKQITTARTVPCLYLDDCFLKNDAEDPIQTVLVVKSKPLGDNSGSTLAVPVNAKGPPDQYGLENLPAFIRSHIVARIACRCDGENSLPAAIEHVVGSPRREGFQLVL